MSVLNIATEQQWDTQSWCEETTRCAMVVVVVVVVPWLLLGVGAIAAVAVAVAVGMQWRCVRRLTYVVSIGRVVGGERPAADETL